ncbi:uncharacterized protein LOC107464228 [Arachis duranensis]|uniref:Uncharacterized protein LOC107464228 n=1 Tax=Arachis duranensis TaxID=130453 RepID=A0A6P4BJB0_ARADU|nr:uncharacterized protein LOC107464228 [Arachis duranensis]
MVITARVGTGLVKRILVDTGADSNIMFHNVFDALGLKDADLTTHQHGVIGLGDHFIKPDGVISLPISVGQKQGRRSAMAEFVILRDSTAYNIILGRKTINDFEAIINTKLLVMKFVADDGSIGTIRGDLETAVACDNASLSLRKKSKEASGVFLADLDARVEDNPRPEPEGDLEKFSIGDEGEKFTFVNKNLPHELKEPLIEMIRANKDLFAWTPADMPGIDPQIISHHLAVKPDARPVAQRRRKMSAERAEEVAKQTAGLLEAGFIREVDYSTWLSNVVLVKKHNGRWRMCVDYSDLNKACPKDCFPLPNIDALVDAAAGYRYLSFMDAYSGYNQIPMHRPDEDKTAFITPGGTFCYKVMPFGLKNAGATYQRLMNRIFHNLIGKTVEVYVDDILAKTTRPDDLLNDLASVFASLRQHGMRLNPLKCAFAMEAGKFLGFMITQRGVEANPEKCQSVRFEFPISNNQAEYEALIGGLTLAAEVGARRLEVCSDSQVVTSQVNGSYQAKDPLLLKYLEKVKSLSQKFEEVTVHHVPRERNTRADLLSKLASTKPGEGNRSLIQGMTREPAIALHMTTLGSSWLDPITNFLEHGQVPGDEKDATKLRREAAKYAVIQGQLFKKGLSQPLLKCLHPDQTDYVLREVHEGCCGHHIGGKALARKLIRAGYYWPSMMADAKEFVKKCVKCQQNANFARAPASELSLLTTSRPFAQWGVDLLGPFPVGPGQVKYLIVAIDYYTKWIEAEPLASISSANCRKFMWRHVITRFGIPEVVISDNGTQFTDKKFAEFLSGLGIRQRFSSVEHPQTNGQVESANKVILSGLKKRLDNKKGAWADELAAVLWSYRTTEQSSTKETPFRLTYGVDAVIPVEIGEPSPRLLLKGVEETIEKDLIDEAREMAHLTEIALKQRMALRYNTKVLKREFEPNDLVLRRNDIGLPTPGEGKLAANWEGPFRVKKVMGKGAYKLERLDGKEVPRTWNADNLRRFYS